MERPTFRLAAGGGAVAPGGALRGAGFEPVLIHPEHVESAPAVDLAVLDCDLAKASVQNIYQHLHNGTRTPTLLLVGDHSELPHGVDGGGDEVALKPLPPEAMVYRLQALLIRTGRHLPVESGAWASDESLSAAPIAGGGHVV